LNQFGEALEEVRQSSNGRMFLQTKIERFVNCCTLFLQWVIAKRRTIWAIASMPRPEGGRKTRIFTGTTETKGLMLRRKKK
jgi:hypothetical protein